MRKLCFCFALLTAVAVTYGQAAQNESPRFRGKVDLISIDVAAVDSRGRPVEDLRPGDFTVKVDGTERPVVSAELIKVDGGQPPAAPARPDDALITTNVMPRSARRIVVAVDQTLITPGALAPLLRTASRFVDRLSPADYVAFVGFPEPGPRVDFTRDKARVRREMEGIVGQPQMMFTGDFNISLSEAFTITGPESVQDSSTPPGATLAQLLQGPAMRRVLERGCRGLTFDDLQLMENMGALIRCRQDIYNESLRVAAQARLDADIAMRALERLLRSLAALEGPKSMILFSAGLVNDNPLLLDEVGRLAAAARTSINVIAVDREREQVIMNMPNGQSALSLVDRSYELQGLEVIADRTGGGLFRGVASGEGIFERLESELSAWYLVAVERQPGDPERQRIDVGIKRRGVTLRSNRTVVTAPATAGSQDEMLSEALSSPFAIPEIPLRVSTFTQRDSEPGTYRVRLAAQVGQPGDRAGEFAVGYVLADNAGRVVTSGGSRRTLSPPASGPNQLLHYETSIRVEPGSYLVRFGVVDKEGRRGTVVHPIELARIDTRGIATSDLVVGNLPAEGETLRPSVEPQVTASELAGYLEVYLPDAAQGDGVTVTLEIAEGESSPALSSATLTLRSGGDPSSRIATGFVDATMTPGRYLARATVRLDGAAVRTLSRPIAIVRDPAVVSRPDTRTRGVAMPPDMQRRTAAYVAGVVGGLGNVVAQENFVLTRPDRRVTSDLLLVRYPGTERDLIPYRDVAQVDAAAIPGREQRLLDLFVKPTEGLRQRARQIMLNADRYVPSVFNPLFVLAFMQSDFQSRFELTVADAGAEWPPEVKAVRFVETARPTLLRAGPLADIDIPTSGTAWIEEGTGRIVQTELQVGRGRSAPAMITRFTLDERLQVMVPQTMRTRNPDGIATYTNLRRFVVATETAIPPIGDGR